MIDASQDPGRAVGSGGLPARVVRGACRQKPRSKKEKSQTPEPDSIEALIDEQTLAITVTQQWVWQNFRGLRPVKKDKL